jgi:hypothetical protein
MSWLRTVWLGLAALLLTTLTPAVSSAAWFGLRNDTKVPIVVQTGVMINNKLVPGRPAVLYPGEVAWDCAVKPCIKVIAIYDPKNPKVPLLQKTMPLGPIDVFLSVKTPAPGVITLTPATPPPNPKRR